MINIRLHITWPLLLTLLLAAILLIFRTPVRGAATAAPSPRPRPMAQRARPRSARHRDVIFKAAPDYDAETDRLDQEAAEAACQVYDHSTAYEIKTPVWRNHA